MFTVCVNWLSVLSQSRYVDIPAYFQRPAIPLFLYPNDEHGVGSAGFIPGHNEEVVFCTRQTMTQGGVKD